MEQLAGWSCGTVHISPAPGEAEGQKPGINIELPPEPDVFAQNTIAQAAATISWALESWGEREEEVSTARP